MNQHILTRKQVREVDRIAIREYGVPGVVLMENAGRGCAELLLRQPVLQRVCICCGKGNNGGDGFVIARHLLNRRIKVDVLLFANPQELQGDAAINCNILQKSGVKLFVNPSQAVLDQKLSEAEWVVDALLGTGMTGNVREPFVGIIHAINVSEKPVLSIDLPSGLDCDTGEVLGCCVTAKLTATFIAHKPAFEMESARSFTGEIHVIDIGVPIQLLTSLTLDEK